MKKIAYTLATSLLLTSAAVAENIPAPSANPATCANFSGFYLGGLIGYGSGKGKTDVTFTRTPVGGVATSDSDNPDVSIDGINGGFVAGYGKSIGRSKVYLGLDLSYTFDASKGKAAAIQVRRKDSLELAARFGVILANAMPFIKLGWANSKIEGEFQNANGGNRKYLNKRLNAFLAGLGVDVKLTQHIVAGLDYTYAVFQKKGASFALTNNAVFINGSGNARTKVSDNKVRIKVAYQF